MFEEDYDGPFEANDTGVTIPVEVTVSWNNAAMVANTEQRLADRIYDDIKAEVEKRVLPALGDQVNLAIASVLNQEVQPTDRFGKPTGEKSSIRELLMRDAEQWLNEKVDEYGTSGRGYGARMSRVEYLFKRVLKGDKHDGESPITKLVKAALASQIGDVTEMVNQTVREQIAKKLK